MSKQAVIKWNAEKLKSIKRDMLLFNSLYYDPYLLELQIKLLENVSGLFDFNPEIIDEIYTNVEYLKEVGALNEFKLNEFKKDNLKIKSINQNEVSNIIKTVKIYESAHNEFLKKYEQVVRILKKDTNQGLLKYTCLLEDFSRFSDCHVRLTSIILRNTNPDISLTPIIKNLEDIKESKETEVLRVIFKNLPIPDDMTPLDEVLSFRSDEDNHRRYLGLINWVNKISKSNLSIHEIEDELNYYTIEFEHRMKLEKSKYRLTNLEVLASLPLEIVESIIKLNWSKIPKTICHIQKNKVNLLLAETKAPGKEVAYITFSNERFEKNVKELKTSKTNFLYKVNRFLSGGSS